MTLNKKSISFFRYYEFVVVPSDFQSAVRFVWFVVKFLLINYSPTFGSSLRTLRLCVINYKRISFQFMLSGLIP